PRVDDLTAADAGQRPDGDDPIACLDRLLVVLDDHEGVAEVAQRLERTDETSVVALVQADRRLVEHVEHAREPRADLRRKTDALRLAARQRPGRAAQRQVVEAHAEQELKADADLAKHLRGDLRDRKSTRLNSSHVKISYA